MGGVPDCVPKRGYGTTNSQPSSFEGPPKNPKGSSEQVGGGG